MIALGNLKFRCFVFENQTGFQDYYAKFSVQHVSAALREHIWVKVFKMNQEKFVEDSR